MMSRLSPKRCSMFLLVVLASLLVPAARAEARAVDLTARFDRSTPTVYEVDLKSRQVLRLGEVTQDYTATYRSRVSIRLERANSELVSVKLTHERVAVSFEGRGGGAPGSLPMGSYDSSDPDAAGTSDVYRRIVAPIVGKSVVIDLLPSGEFVAVRGLNDLAPSGPAGVMFRELFTEQTFRDMYGWLFRLKSDPSTAEPGESWTIAQSANNPLGTLRRVYELTLGAVDGSSKTATIEIGGKVELQGSVPGMFEPTGGADAQAVSGTAEWDVEGKQVVSLSSTSKTDIESTTPGMPVKMSIEAETKVKRVGG